MAKGRRYLGSEIVFNVILTIFVLLCVLPVIHVIAKSISGRAPVVAGKVYLLPKEIDFSAYASVFNDPTMIQALWYSILWTVVYTALAMVSTILLAYPLSRHYLPGRKTLMVLVLIPMYFTGGTIANFLWVKQMGLIDSPWSLVLPILTSTYNTIILQILVRIILPLSTASLATIALFYAVARWNNYADVRYYINTSSKFTLQMKLYQVVFASSSTDVSMVEGGKNSILAETIQCAAVVFSTVPILIVYPFLQRYFVQGVMIGTVKE